jgi:hypothetical protein
VARWKLSKYKGITKTNSAVRSKLFISGLMMVGLAVLFFGLQLPLVYFWSIPFGIAGIIMMLVAPFLKESEGPISPPEGYVFCVFCGNLMPRDIKRCSVCNGVQPRES